MSAADPLPALPPTYSNDIDVLGIPAFVSDLPAYSPGRPPPPGARPGNRPFERREFHHELKKKGSPFAVLTISSEGPYSKTLPTFIEGQPIVGKVRLSLEKPEVIHSVIVSVSHCENDMVWQSDNCFPFPGLSHLLGHWPSYNWCQSGRTADFHPHYADALVSS